MEVPRWQHKRAPLGERVHEKGGETEGVFGGDTELRVTCSEKDEMEMSKELHPIVPFALRQSKLIYIIITSLAERIPTCIPTRKEIHA